MSGEAGAARAKSTAPAWVVSAVNGKSVIGAARRNLDASAAFAAICALTHESNHFWLSYRHLFLRAMLRSSATAPSESGRSGRPRAPSLSSWDEAGIHSIPKRGRVQPSTWQRNRINFYLLVDKAFSSALSSDPGDEVAVQDAAESFSEFVTMVQQASNLQR